MKKSRIKGISIDGESGFAAFEDMYKEKFTIDCTGAKYEYIPKIESEINTTEKWSYKTENPDFLQIFEKICGAVYKILTSDENKEYTDVGAIVFNVTYDDGEKISKSFFCPGDEFGELFSILKKTVPKNESMPRIFT